MLENITSNQLIGLVFILLSIGVFITTIYKSKKKRFIIKGGLENPKMFKLHQYGRVILGLILLIIGILLIVTIIGY